MRTFAQKPKAPQQTTFAKSTKPSRTFIGQSREVTPILYLQRTIGNHAVQRLLDANTRDVKTDSATTEIAHFGHDFSQIPVHAADLTTPAQPTIQQPAQDPNQLPTGPSSTTGQLVHRAVAGQRGHRPDRSEYCPGAEVARAAPIGDHPSLRSRAQYQGSPADERKRRRGRPGVSAHRHEFVLWAGREALPSDQATACVH